MKANRLSIIALNTPIMIKNALLLLFFTCTVAFTYSQGNQIIEEDQYFEDSILHGTSTSGQHNTLSQAVLAADLQQILDNDGPYTVFAPSDAAFNKWPGQKMDELFKPQNKTELQSLITYHMIAGKITASKILKAMCRGEGEARFTTVQGNTLVARMDGIDIVLEDGFGNQARITRADQDRCNGIIHVIDSVVMPSKI